MTRPVVPLLVAAAAAAVSAATPRFAMYLDQYHTAALPGKNKTGGINYVITAFAPSNLFNWQSGYDPFKPVAEIRTMFDDGAKVCMAIGGWGDTSGFSAAIASGYNRKNYAKNVADAVRSLGYDCVDVDWEYPGGNGQDYRQIPNFQKSGEIEAYPQLLCDIKEAIGTEKELSAAIPGKEIDMMAFTPANIERLNNCTDFFNVMTYDLMNRRDHTTNHHSSVKGVCKTIDTYIERGMEPGKMNVSLPFYAKYFETTGECKQPVGCETALLEYPDGTDTGRSGAKTFEAENAAGAEFAKVLKNGREDNDEGGQWYWDADTKRFWTWDEPKFIAQKLALAAERKLGGIFAWSLGEDSLDWRHLRAMQDGFAKHWGPSNQTQG